MKTILFNLATAKEKWAEEAHNLYKNKISHFTSFEVQTLKVKKAPRHQSEIKKNVESEVILENLTKDDFIILFDEKGKSLNSIQFSKKIQNVQMSGKKRLVIIIGGAYGVSEVVKQKAHEIISLSSMTMNHVVAEVVVLEQIYRAFTIIKNISYHNE